MVDVEIIQGDAARLNLPNCSVDLVVTSPPYWGQRIYRDNGEAVRGQLGSEDDVATYINALLRCTREWVRVLKPAGSIWVNLGDKYGKDKSLIGLPWRYAIGCIDEIGLTLRAEVVWSKTNAMPESVSDRVRRSHESWYHFTTRTDYFASIDAIREPYSNKRSLSRRIKRPGDGKYDQRAAWSQENPLGKVPSSVWNVATQPLKIPPELGVNHYAPFPMELPRRIILGWSPVGGTVLDPFGGTGTTALVASSHGRRAVSVDISADYCRIAAWRVNDPKQQERARFGGALQHEKG